MDNWKVGGQISKERDSKLVSRCRKRGMWVPIWTGDECTGRQTTTTTDRKKQLDGQDGWMSRHVVMKMSG